MTQFWRSRRVRQRVQLIQLEMFAYIAPDLWPPNISDLNQVNNGTKFSEKCRIVQYAQ